MPNSFVCLVFSCVISLSSELSVNGANLDVGYVCGVRKYSIYFRKEKNKICSSSPIWSRYNESLPPQFSLVGQDVKGNTTTIFNFFSLLSRSIVSQEWIRGEPVYTVEFTFLRLRKHIYDIKNLSNRYIYVQYFFPIRIPAILEWFQFGRIRATWSDLQ